MWSVSFIRDPRWRAGPARTSRQLRSARKFPPYLVLLRVGFTMPRALQRERCALTAPFHPYLAIRENNQAVFSLWHWPYPGLETWTPDVIRHTALRSSDFPPPRNITMYKYRHPRGSGRPAHLHLYATSRKSYGRILVTTTIIGGLQPLPIQDRVPQVSRLRPGLTPSPNPR